MKLLNKKEMRNITTLVNVPQSNHMRERRGESRFSEIRLYQRRQNPNPERFIIIHSSDTRI